MIFVAGLLIGFVGGIVITLSAFKAAVKKLTCSR